MGAFQCVAQASAPRQGPLLTCCCHPAGSLPSFENTNTLSPTSRLPRLLRPRVAPRNQPQQELAMVRRQQQRAPAALAARSSRGTRRLGWRRRWMWSVCGRRLPTSLASTTSETFAR